MAMPQNQGAGVRGRDDGRQTGRWRSIWRMFAPSVYGYALSIEAADLLAISAFVTVFNSCLIFHLQTSPLRCYSAEKDRLDSIHGRTQLSIS
jgi:hypothetical protein